MMTKVEKAFLHYIHNEFVSNPPGLNNVRGSTPNGEKVIRSLIAGSYLNPDSFKDPIGGLSWNGSNPLTTKGYDYLHSNAWRRFKKNAVIEFIIDISGVLAFIISTTIVILKYFID